MSSPSKYSPAVRRLHYYGVGVREVALAAGLSHAAVSRALAGDSRTAATLPRIRAAIERVAEDPKAAARVLALVPKAS